MVNMDIIGKTATMIYRDRFDYTCVRYHNTDVVKFNNKIAILNTNGWRTKTTKVRMNQTSNQNNLGFHVFQKNNDWFVTIREKTVPFKDGLVIQLNSSE